MINLNIGINTGDNYAKSFELQKRPFFDTIFNSIKNLFSDGCPEVEEVKNFILHNEKFFERIYKDKLIPSLDFVFALNSSKSQSYMLFVYVFQLLDFNIQAVKHIIKYGPERDNKGNPLEIRYPDINWTKKSSDDWTLGIEFKKNYELAKFVDKKKILDLVDKNKLNLNKTTAEEAANTYVTTYKLLKQHMEKQKYAYHIDELEGAPGEIFFYNTLKYMIKNLNNLIDDFNAKKDFIKSFKNGDKLFGFMCWSINSTWDNVDVLMPKLYDICQYLYDSNSYFKTSNKAIKTK